jgi:hypothetical protein
VSAEDTALIARYGTKAYTEAGDLPWAGKNDAEAIAQLVLSQRAERLPIASVRLVGNNSDRLSNMMGRELSDRVTLVDAETGLDRDFYIEQIEHTVSDAGLMNVTTFGCEALAELPADVFILDEGELDVNKLGSVGIDDPGSIFIFGDSTQGALGTGMFAH